MEHLDNNVTFKQKRKKSLITILIVTALFIGGNYLVPFIGYSSNSIIVAEAVESAQETYNRVQGSNGGVLGSDIKAKITNLSADAQSIVLTIVMGILICSTLLTSTKFGSAGDNPQKKALLKSSLIAQIGGIIFVASYSGAILFGLNNLNLFG